MSRFYKDLRAFVNGFPTKKDNVSKQVVTNDNEFVASSLEYNDWPKKFVYIRQGYKGVADNIISTYGWPPNEGPETVNLRLVGEKPRFIDEKGTYIDPKVDQGLTGTGYRFNGAQASYGAYQISWFLLVKLGIIRSANGFFLHNNKLNYNPFEEKELLDWILNCYSQVRINVKTGQERDSKNVGLDHGLGSLIKFLDPWRAKAGDKPYASADSHLNSLSKSAKGVLHPGARGFLIGKQELEAYDERYRQRLVPSLFGATDHTPENQNSKISGKFLPELFMDYLKPKIKGSDSAWSTKITDSERRAFLLMGGDYYTKNDYFLLNILDRPDTPGQKWKHISSKVFKFWKENYQAARDVEDAKAGAKGVALTALNELIGEDPTVRTFAMHVTHGAPGNSPIVNDIIPYKSYNSATEREGFNFSPNSKMQYSAICSSIGGTNEKPMTQKATIGCPKYSLMDAASRPFRGNFDDLTLLMGTDTVGYKIAQRGDEYHGNWPKAGNNQNWISPGPEGDLGYFNVNNDGYAALKEAGATIVDTPARFPGYFEEKSIVSGARDINVAAPPSNEWSEGKTSSPPIGAFFDVPAENSFLDYNVSKQVEALKQALIDSAANAIGGEYSGIKQGAAPNKFFERLYDPLDQIGRVLNNEFKNLKDRIQRYSKEVKKSGTESAIKLNLTLDTPTESKDAVVLRRLWIDAVNVASLKVAYWVALLMGNVSNARRFYIAQFIANHDKLSRDDAAKKLKDSGVSKDTPLSNPNRAFKVTLPTLTQPERVMIDDKEAKRIVEERRANIDQCLLLTNLQTFSKTAQEAVMDELFSARQAQGGKSTKGGTVRYKEGQTPHRKFNIKTSRFVARPYGGRIHLLRSKRGECSSILNKLYAAPGDLIRPFLDITPDIVSGLTPKIRIFRINTKPDGSDNEIEFTFDNFVSEEETNTLQKHRPVIQKGRGVGIKNFSFSYEGGTPATAKKDIQAELTLYFQSFNELTKIRGSGQNTYRYIDLLLYPYNTAGGKTQNKKLNKGKAKNTSVHPVQYNPNNFRIRADVGWNTRSDNAFREILYRHFIKNKKQKGYEGRELEGKKERQRKDNLINDFNQSLETINKSLLLNMIDHDIDFRNDGSVEIKINYAAYLESETRSSSTNALSTPQIEQYRKNKNEEILELLETDECTAQELNALKAVQALQDKNYIKAAEGSIMKRLTTRKHIIKALFDEKQTREYLKDFAAVPPKISHKKIGIFEKLKAKKNKKTGKEEEREVQFFYMGDLIHTIMDCLYRPVSSLSPNYEPRRDNTKEFLQRRREVDKYAIALCDFLYSDYNSKKPIFATNIAYVPISVKFFNEWMTENVIKGDRIIYPLTQFVRDLMNALVSLMTDACINRQVDQSLMFQTTQINALGKGRYYEDPLEMARRVGQGSMRVDPNIDVDRVYNISAVAKKEKNQHLPLKTGDFYNGKRQEMKNYYKYSIIYPVSPTLTSGHQGKGVRQSDELVGRYHFQIGSPKGLLKNVKFSKTDMAYLREARFFNQGNYGLLQLGAVYNVELQLIGNTIFYPGMEVFIDPRGFGGDLWDPTVGGDNRSIANALGIGGYHVITKVTNNISTSGFTTTVNAVFQYSGDGESLSMAIDGKSMQTKPNKKLKKPGKKVGTDKCQKAFNSQLEQSLKIESLIKKKEGNKGKGNSRVQSSTREKK